MTNCGDLQKFQQIRFSCFHVVPSQILCGLLTLGQQILDFEIGGHLPRHLFFFACRAAAAAMRASRSLQTRKA